MRHRLNRGGNRRLNAILYRIALTQAHYSPDARTYLARRLSEGKTKKEAIRALKRFIVRAVWRSWTECQSNQASARPCTTYRLYIGAFNRGRPGFRPPDETGSSVQSAALALRDNQRRRGAVG